MRLNFESATDRLNKTQLNGTDSWYVKSDKSTYLVLRDQTGRWNKYYYASYMIPTVNGLKTTMLKGPGPDGSYPNAITACAALQAIEDGLQ